MLHQNTDVNIEKIVEQMFNKMIAINTSASLARVDGISTAELEVLFESALTQCGQNLFNYIFLDNSRIMDITMH
jgi:BarA-like signal transduction histidine kinase